MGRGFVQYHLPESGREEWVLLSAFIDYRLADGTKLRILQQPAWCPTCARFVIAECPSAEELEEEFSKKVVQYEDTYRLCYIRGPEGILIGLAQQLGQQTPRANPMRQVPT